MAALAGKWKLASSELFDEYMKAIGVGLMTRKMAGTLKPNQEIYIDGDKWQIKTISTFKTTDLSFTLGTEFDETTADGRKVKSTCTLDEDKLVHIQKGEVTTTLTRQVVDGVMIMTCAAKEIVCTRKYQRDA